MKFKKILGQYFGTNNSVSIMLVLTDMGYMVTYNDAQREGDFWQQMEMDFSTALDVFKESVLATIEQTGDEG